MGASFYGRLEVINALVQAGADVNAGDKVRERVRGVRRKVRYCIIIGETTISNNVSGGTACNVWPSPLRL